MVDNAAALSSEQGRLTTAPKRKNNNRTFVEKCSILLELIQGKTLQSVSSTHGVAERQLRYWRNMFVPADYRTALRTFERYGKNEAAIPHIEKYLIPMKERRNNRRRRTPGARANAGTAATNGDYTSVLHYSNVTGIVVQGAMGDPLVQHLLNEDVKRAAWMSASLSVCPIFVVDSLRFNNVVLGGGRYLQTAASVGMFGYRSAVYVCGNNPTPAKVHVDSVTLDPQTEIVEANIYSGVLVSGTVDGLETWPAARCPLCLKVNIRNSDDLLLHYTNGSCRPKHGPINLVRIDRVTCHVCCGGRLCDNEGNACYLTSVTQPAEYPSPLSGTPAQLVPTFEDVARTALQRLAAFHTGPSGQRIVIPETPSLVHKKFDSWAVDPLPCGVDMVVVSFPAKTSDTAHISVPVSGTPTPATVTVAPATATTTTTTTSVSDTKPDFPTPPESTSSFDEDRQQQRVPPKKRRIESGAAAAAAISRRKPAVSATTFESRDVGDNTSVLVAPPVLEVAAAAAAVDVGDNAVAAAAVVQPKPCACDVKKVTVKKVAGDISVIVSRFITAMSVSGSACVWWNAFTMWSTIFINEVAATAANASAACVTCPSCKLDIDEYSRCLRLSCSDVVACWRCLLYFVVKSNNANAPKINELAESLWSVLTIEEREAVVFNLATLAARQCTKLCCSHTVVFDTASHPSFVPKIQKYCRYRCTKCTRETNIDYVSPRIKLFRI